MVVMEPKERIRKKANDLVMQYGIRSVSMDDIAAALGMSKKTIYQFYADKDELVDAVVDDELRQTEVDCVYCKTNAGNAVEEMVMTMEQIHDQFQNMNPMVLYDLQKFHPTSFEKFLKHKNEFLFKIIKQNIERGVREELYRPEINVDVISKFRLEAMLIPFNIAVYPPGKYSLAAVTQETMEHFLYGLASLKGYKMILKYKKDFHKKPKPNHDELSKNR
jgi:TetR/AcrR family transcriptional regulator, cholesterol catabolism regulator